MTKQEWLDTAKTNQEILKEFILDWHPTNKIRPKPEMTITAPRTEEASEIVRALIRNNAGLIEPIVRFDLALFQSDIIGIHNVLSEAWFGVPESTSCWDIPGFSEAVALLEDLPEEDDL